MHERAEQKRIKKDNKKKKKKKKKKTAVKEEGGKKMTCQKGESTGRVRHFGVARESKENAKGNKRGFRRSNSIP